MIFHPHASRGAVVTISDCKEIERARLHQFHDGLLRGRPVSESEEVSFIAES